jgi:cell division protease FtsH
MSRMWRRLKRPLAWLLGIAALWYVSVLFLGWVGVSPGGPGTPTQSFSPADVTRNFFSVWHWGVSTYAFLFLQFAFFPFIIVMQFALLYWFLARGTTYTLFPGEYDVTFDDVRGQDHVVKSTKEVMSIFQGYKDFRKLGGHPPRGVLFEGPPGTGKTLMAKAIAGETGVPFMYASGAGFANMFLGIPQLKVRGMFKKARRYSERWGGCVVFIDELDSIGASRTGSASLSQAYPSDPHAPGAFINRYVIPNMGGGGTNLVNALLTEIDGVDKPPRMQRWFRRHLRLAPVTVNRHNLLIIGATNLASVLDQALLRPGRFDRKMHVGIPTREGRRDIIAYYMGKVNHEPIDLDHVAKITSGYSPAALRSLVNEALLVALQNGRQALTWDDVWKAYLTNEAGIAENVQYSQKVKEKTALHEAGHAMCTHFLAANTNVSILTIRKRQGALGIQFGHSEEETFGMTRNEMLADIKVCLGGMVAEEIWYGETSTGPSSDLNMATRRVLYMLTHLGMGSTLLSYGPLEGRGMSDDDVAVALKNPEIAAEANRILVECKTDVRVLLTEKKAAMEAVRDALVAKGEISGDEFRDILWKVGALGERPSTLRTVPIAPAWVGAPPAGGYPPPAPGWGPPVGPPPPGGNGGHGQPGGWGSNPGSRTQSDEGGRRGSGG